MRLSGAQHLGRSHSDGHIWCHDNSCHECLTEGHLSEANFCLHCGAHLPKYFSDAGPARRQGD